MLEQIVYALVVVVVITAALLFLTKIDPAFKKPWVMSAFDPKWSEDDA